jgi:hypothetical protein
LGNSSLKTKETRIRHFLAAFYQEIKTATSKTDFRRFKPEEFRIVTVEKSEGRNDSSKNKIIFSTKVNARNKRKR